MTRRTGQKNAQWQNLPLIVALTLLLVMLLSSLTMDITNTTFKGVKQFTQQALWNLIDMHDMILEHRVMQTHYSNKHQRPSVIYHEKDLVYVNVFNETANRRLG